jgi:indolepyruvate ferredoxin oxidoreductase, beta subunit
VVVSDEQIPTLAMVGNTPYPEDDAITAALRARAGQVHLLPAGSLAADLGNQRVANVILMGTLSHYLDISAEVWQQAIAERVPPKHRELNRRAFELGRARVADDK